jgi:hypothetical protein
MADTHDMRDGKDFCFDVSQACILFPLKDETPEKTLDPYHSLKSMEERIQYAK